MARLPKVSLQPKTYVPAKSYGLQTALSGCLPEAASLIHRACTADTCSRDLQQRLAAEPLYSLRPLLSHAPLSKTSVLPPPISPIHSYRKAHAQQTVSCDNTQQLPIPALGQLLCFRRISSPDWLCPYAPSVLKCYQVLSFLKQESFRSNGHPDSAQPSPP